MEEISSKGAAFRFHRLRRLFLRIRRSFFSFAEIRPRQRFHDGIIPEDFGGERPFKRTGYKASGIDGKILGAE